jgi:hypothetical protein
MTGKKFISWILLAVALAFAAMPLLTPFAGFDPQAFPNPQDNPPAQPAGYAFSIWGVIYLWLLVSAVVGVIRYSSQSDWAAARPMLALSLGFGVFWLPVAPINPLAATVLIWLMLATALAALVRTPRDNRILFRAPVALYAGWLAAASWVSVALVGAGYGIAFDQRGWAAIAIGAAALTSLAVLMTVPDIPEFGASVIWGLVAISAKSGQSDPDIALLAGLAAMMLALVVIFLSQKRQNDLPGP